MALLFGLLGSWVRSDNPRSKSGKSRRRLRFESLEDRQLLAVGTPGDGIVLPGETEIIDGVEYSVPDTESNSLKLETVFYLNKNDVELGKYVIITNFDSDAPVDKYTVSGTYNGKAYGGSYDAYGITYDDTTADVTITGVIPAFMKRDDGDILVKDGGSVGTSAYQTGLGGIAGKDINITIDDGGFACLKATLNGNVKGDGKVDYLKYAKNVTINTGGTAIGTSFGDKDSTTIDVKGGSLTWASNNQNNLFTPNNYVKSFSMSSGSMVLENGQYNIGAITGGTVTCNSASGTYSFDDVVSGEAAITLQNYSVASFAENVSNLTVGDGTAITINAGKTIENLTLNGSGSITLYGTATNMTVNSGMATIKIGASIGTLNINGGTISFESLPTGTTYKVAPGKSFICGDTIYLNATAETITTDNPAEDLTTSNTVVAIDAFSGYYVISGEANVVLGTLTFGDGTADGSGTVYGFYGVNESPVTLVAGASASYSGVVMTPYSSSVDVIPANVTFLMESPGARITGGVAGVSGTGAFYVEGGITANILVTGEDQLKAFIRSSTFATERSTLLFKGLRIYQSYGRTINGKPMAYNDSLSFSEAELLIGKNMAGTYIESVDSTVTSDLTIRNRCHGSRLYANVSSVVNEYLGMLIYSEVGTVTVRSLDGGDSSAVQIADGGDATSVILESGQTSVGLTGTGHADTVTISADSEYSSSGNLALKDTSSVETVTMPEGTLLTTQRRLQETTDAAGNVTIENLQGTRVGTETGGLTLKPSAILQSSTYTLIWKPGWTTPNYTEELNYTLLADTTMTGHVNTDGSSVFTVADADALITLNGLNYTTTEDNVVITISATGGISAGEGKLTAESGVRITTLQDVVSDMDQYISLREAIAYAKEKISWTTKPKDEFIEGGCGYDFSTGKIVVKKDMVEGTDYYVPVRSDGRNVYDGSRASIEAAIVHFDSALASETNLTITLDKDLGDLTIDQSIVIDGKIGDRSVTIDRGLIDYHADKFDLYNVCQNENALGEKGLGEIWEVKEEGVYGRVLNLTATVPVALSNLILQGAHNNANGGAIYSKANLTLANVSIVGNVFTVTDTTGTDKFGVGIWNDGGTISMYGGSLEGNWANGDDDNEGGTVYSVAVSSMENSLYFDDVEVLQNKVADGSFIYTNCDEEIVIKNTHVYKNSGNVFDGAFASDYVITDSLFEDNYGGGNFWFRGEITITDSVFNNSSYDPAINGYTSEDEYYNYYAAFLNEGGTADDPNTFNITNSLFNKVAFELVYNSTYTVFTMNNCTVTGCNDYIATSKVGFRIYDDEDVNIDSTVNVTLNDTLLLGNGIDLLNENTGANITITVNDSIVGYYDDARNDVLTKTNSIVEVYEAGAVEFVQTDDPDASGYYEAKTATVNDRTINLLGTSEGGDTVSVLGYHYGVATDLTTQKIADDFYTTVTTLEDTNDSNDGVISLREAVIYAEANSDTDRPLTITFDENLADAEGGPTIKLGSNLYINADNLSIDGTLKAGQVVIIDKAETATGDVRLKNLGTLSLSDINLPVGLIGSATENSTTVGGNVSLGYFAGPDADIAGCLSVEQTAVLTISTFDASANESVYRIHHDTLVSPATTGDPLFLFATDGTIGSYKIGTEGIESADLMQLTSVVAAPFYTEDTAGIKVADILFFGNERLPVGTNDATFAVTKDGTMPVTDYFEWIYKDTDETEVYGLKVKDATILTAGAYSVTVTYSDLVKTFSFNVLETVSVTFDESTGTATPQNKKLTEVVLTTGEAHSFYTDPAYNLTWGSSEAELNVNDYFTVEAGESDAKTFILVYKGGLAARDTVYSVRVTAMDDYKSASTSTDFALTVVTPTLSLSPDQGEITDFTAKAELATVSLDNFIPSDSINWTFKLNDLDDTVHFSVDANDKLIYTGNGALLPGVYSLEVTADNGIDSASDVYALTIKECSLQVDTIFASITTNNHDLDIARLIPVNFPAGTMEYSLAWDRLEDINGYFSVVTNELNQSYLHHKSTLGIGVYTIAVTAICDATNSDDGDVVVTVLTQLSVTAPGEEASVVLDPTNKEIETTTAVNDYQLASVALQAFEEVPVITVTAWNTTTKNTDGEVELKNYSDCFTVVDGKLKVVQSTLTQELISGEYEVTVKATTYSVDNNIVQQAEAEFILTLYDKKVETESSNITIDFNPTTEEFEVKETGKPEEDPIETGEANVLIIDLKDTTVTPIITITNEAMKNLDAIHIKSDVENVIVVKDTGVVPGPDVPSPNHFIIDSATDIYPDRPTAVTITANESDTDSQIAKTTSSGTKSISITSTEGKATQYDINTLSTNILINTNTDTAAKDTISFAGGSSQTGIVLNLDKTEFGQSVYTGQPGTLTLNGPLGGVKLSPGNDIVTGSKAGSVITDTSDSWNTITLNGDSSDAENVVNLNGGSTIIVNGAATNKITVENADNTSLNLAHATGLSTATIVGDKTTVTGGVGSNTINITGDFAIINSPNSTNNMIVNIKGNGGIIKTGSGADVIHIEGNDSLVSSGAGDDTIYLEADSKGNSIGTGDGDDIVISTSTGGNTIYVDAGNDFIIGGDGRDRIFGGAGNSILAGGRGADRIIGGTARDIMLANTSVNLDGKTAAQLIEIRNQLFETEDLDDALAILGESSVSDGEVDSITRESESGIDVFFYNYDEGDTLNNVLDGDLLYD